MNSRLWMLSWLMALNAKLTTLNVKLKIWWLWMPDHERRLWMPNYGEMMALNTKLRIRWLWKPNCWEMVYAWLWTMDLNAKLWATGSKCQTMEKWWLCTPECGRWLWTPELWMMALNAWTVDKSWRLWMLNWRCGFECQAGNQWWL